MTALPDLDALRLLRLVLQEGSISAAARRAGITQQAASARIRGMERGLGLELIARSPGGARPTADGEVFSAWAEELLEAADRLADAVDALRGERAREVSVAASQTVAAHLLPSWLVRVRRRQTADRREPTTVRIRTANSDRVVELVRAGHAEVGFIETPGPPSGLSHTAVGADELVVALHPEDPRAARERLRIDELAGTPLVAREQGSGTRSAWERAVRLSTGRDPVAPAVVLENAAAIRFAVADRVAPAVLSRLVIADDVRLGRLAGVPLDPVVIRPITAVWRGAERDLPPFGRELIAAAVAPQEGPA